MFKTPTQPIPIKEADELKLFNMSSRTLYRRCKSGAIETVIVNNVVCITPEAVVAYQRSRLWGLTINAVLEDQLAFADLVIESEQNRARIKAFLVRWQRELNK